MQGSGKRFSSLAALALTLARSRPADPSSTEARPGARRPRRSRPSPGRARRALRQGGELLEGGVRAYERPLEELRGLPVVVNKWASWCGPCRAEFPFFQRQAAKRGERVAFVGVDANDAPDAARTFLEDFPIPYPSFSDPDEEIAELLDGAREFPATAFYDSDGELVYVKRGGYAVRGRPRGRHRALREPDGRRYLDPSPFGGG